MSVEVASAQVTLHPRRNRAGKTASEILRAEAVKADEMALEETRIADSCRAESDRRLESAADYRNHADQLRADADRLEAQS